jgi:putative nucleotidyltransferase with HDIG domain
MTENTGFSILLIDDEAAILKSLQRLLRRTGLRVMTASSGAEGLELINKEPENIALIVSDQRMPEMNGAQFFEHAKSVVPDAFRFLLTGYSELEALADSINKGEIHHYITKPWEDAELLGLILGAVEKFQLKKENQRLIALTNRQNQELLQFNKRLEELVKERTQDLQQKQKELEASLYNSIRAFASLLNLHNHALAEHCRRVSIISGRIAEQMKLPEEKVTHIEIAALLHDIGKLGLSPNLLNYNSKGWTDEEKKQFSRHPIQGQQIVQFINQLSSVGKMVRSHHERFDGKGFPDGLSGIDIPLGARIITIADVFDKMVNFGVGAELLINNYLSSLDHPIELSRREILKKAALQYLKQNEQTFFDPDLVQILFNVIEQKKLITESETLILINELQPGMVLSKTLYSVKGHFLLQRRTRLTAEHIPKLAALRKINLIEDKISILGLLTSPDQNLAPE